MSKSKSDTRELIHAVIQLDIYLTRRTNRNDIVNHIAGNLLSNNVNIYQLFEIINNQLFGLPGQTTTWTHIWCFQAVFPSLFNFFLHNATIVLTKIHFKVFVASAKVPHGLKVTFKFRHFYFDFILAGITKGIMNPVTHHEVLRSYTI